MYVARHTIHTHPPHPTRYDVGDVDTTTLNGEALVSALVMQQEGRVVARGAAGVLATTPGTVGVQPMAQEIPGKALSEMLMFPEGWGPTEWGPIPFLPTPDILVGYGWCVYV